VHGEDMKDLTGDATERGDVVATDEAAPNPVPVLRTRASILIVDDKPQNLYALTEMLASIDAEVVQATSGANALKALLKQDFAIVLVDIQMPDMDGYELAALIRRRKRSRHVPIIFVTAYNKDDQDITRGYALGAVDYVFKPIEPVILKAKISVFVDLFMKTEEVRRQVELERELQLENMRVRTEKIDAERALRQVEERQALIVKSVPIVLYNASLKDGFAGPRFLSESFAAAVGFPVSAFVEDLDLWAARIHPDDLGKVMSQIRTAAERGSMSVEYRWRCADGSERVFMDRAVLTRDENGEPKDLVGTCLDISEKQRLEQQLLHAQKMEAIGQLTGGIAHDFNNMLSVILWNVNALVRALEGRGKLHDHAQMALSGALNCAELIRQLLTFARHEPRQAKTIDLSELVPRVAKMITSVLGKQIKTSVDLSPELWSVYADPAQVESALLNLAINARDAMPEGGSLVIRCGNFNVQPGSLEPEPGNYVSLAVEDSGTGMPKEVIERAFEPFYTTKGPGTGSGLGLSMVYGFAKQSGGHARIDSTMGVGTTVTLYLPKSDRAPEQDEAEVAAPKAQGTGDASSSGGAQPVESHTILVVEDDHNVRDITVARLEELGYRVVEADCGAKALDLLGGDFVVDLLFTDVVMPGGINGIELAKRARQIRPDLKVIFASGYVSSASAEEMPGPLLMKPYRDEALQGALSRMLSVVG
jgi:PAS domain S-box-containing protein